MEGQANPSSTDAKGMLERIVATGLAGGSNQEARAHAKAAVKLALALQHKRTASFQMAALCAEATSSVVQHTCDSRGKKREPAVIGVVTPVGGSSESWWKP